MKWTDCDDGLECGPGYPGMRRWFFEDRDGGWVLHDRSTDELVAGPWADDGDAAHTRDQALAKAEEMIRARQGVVP